MRSKVSYKSHPVHPALIPFPFAFLSGALFFDLFGRLLDNASWWTTAGHLNAVGVVAALVAAVPGLVDYLRTVPPQSSGKRRATKHMVTNLVAVGTFIAVWFIRGPADAPPTDVMLVMEAFGLGLLVVGGWLGGTLVYRNQVGVDHRYAGAGKWKEISVASDGDEPVVVGRTDELKVDQMKLLRVNGRRVVLARTESGYVAFDDHCSHRGGSLADGIVIGGIVQCPWHGSQFDCRTGEVKAGPAAERIATYRASERNGDVVLEVSRALPAHSGHEH